MAEESLGYLLKLFAERLNLASFSGVAIGDYCDH